MMSRQVKPKLYMMHGGNLDEVDSVYYRGPYLPSYGEFKLDKRLAEAICDYSTAEFDTNNSLKGKTLTIALNAPSSADTKLIMTDRYLFR